MERPSACQLCSRELNLTFHHLIPRKVHRRARFQKIYAKAELQDGIWICQPCHRAIHRFYDEMYLATSLNTLTLLLSDEQIQKHVQWVRKQRRVKN